MSRAQWIATLLILTLVAAVSASAQIVPTTTLAIETGNNTAASNLFTATTNGDITPRNVSKVDTRSLLYPGFNGKIYAHLMGWFCQNSGSTATGGGTSCGSGGHIQVGYNSSDPAQVKAQINDMISRGITGVIHDWYGPGSTRDDLETKNYFAEAERHSGYQIALMLDRGIIEWYSCYPSCTATQAVLQAAQYAATFFSSPAYMKWNGRPVLFEFALDEGYTIDWNYVVANTPGNPLWIFQDNGGFTHPDTNGSYSWVMPSDVNYGENYLTDFYSTGLSHPSLYTVGAMYKGFNDTIAGWSANRIMSQQCGQTWLQTFGVANSKHSSSVQLPAIQLVTWDDYEEGTEIETGIDNCVSISATVAGTVLSWSISGAESTIDHFHVFISTDGQNLSDVGDVAAGTHQLDLAGYTFPAGAYTLYVKAVGKPSLTNKMSNPVSWTLAAATSGGGSTGGGGTGTGSSTGKTVGVIASTSTATMMRGQSVQFNLTVTESGASDPVLLSCGTMPAGMSCAFSQSQITPSANSSAVTLTVSASSTMAGLHSSWPRRGLPIYALWMSGLSIAGLVTLPEAVRRKRRLVLVAVLIGLAMLTVACGGGGSSTQAASRAQTTVSLGSSYTVTVNAVSGTASNSTNLTITVN